MVRVIAAERRIVGSAAIGGESAAGREPARHGQPAQIGREARNRIQLLALVLIELRNRGEQRLGVGVADVLEQLHRVGRLDLSPGVHDHHAVGSAGDHPHVVRDQDDPHAELALEPVEQLQDLGLDRHVERGGGLVGDQQLRVAGEGHGDHHPLAQSA